MTFKSWAVGIVTMVIASSISSAAWGADSVYLKSSQSVNQLGAFTQDIAIEIPPGTAGMQPTVALSYNSQMANGLVGKGWSLSGLSIISRCPATMAQDGTISGVNLDSNDKFCLDGMKLLSVSGPGTYGLDGTEYRTETESFSRIFSHVVGTSLQYFVVMDRFGRTSYYGNYDTHEPGAAVVGPNNPTTPIIWALSKVQDLETNFYTITYVNNTALGEYHPTEIDYTGNATASTTPYNAVKFIYSARPDNGPIYRSDSTFQEGYRLTDIQTFANGTEVLDYELLYKLSAESGNSLLYQVGVVSGDGTASLQPITINWNAPSGSYASSIGVPSLTPSSGVAVAANYSGGVNAGNSGSGIYNAGYFQLLKGDFNGDGVTDFAQMVPGASSMPVCLANPGSGFTCTNDAVSTTFSIGTTATFLTGDFDGDGLTDIAQVDWQINTMTVCYSQGDGNFNCTTKTMPGLANGQFLVGDFNGDGMDDIVEVGANGSNSVTLCKSQGRTTDNVCSTVAPPGFVNNYTFTYPTSNGVQFMAGDFDGDGQTDFIELQPGNPTAYVCYSNWSGANQFDCEVKTIPTIGYTGTNFTWYTGDFNGDGLTDFAINTGSGIGGAYICSSVGRTKEPICNMAQMPFENYPIPGGQVNPAETDDLNGDGRSDIITPSADGLSWLLCYLGSNALINCTIVPRSPGHYFLTGNFTGDGKSSILSFDPTFSVVYLAATQQVYPDLVTSVTNGLGAVSTISYAPLTNSTIYQKGAPLTPPASLFNKNVQNSAYVVSSLNEPDGIGGIHSIAYSYAGALQDLSGRGFLGFSSITQKDLTSNQEVLTNYNQSYPLAGFPSSVVTSILQGSTWNRADEKDFTYTITNFGGTSRDFVYLSTLVDNSYDFVHNTLSSTATTLNTYDTYGRLHLSTMTTGDGYQKVTTNTWATPGSIWFLDQLVTSQQTNTNPDSTSVTRTTQDTFSSTFPNELLVEQLQPGGADYLTKTYGYDSFGNRISVTTTGSGMASRGSTIYYDSLGQFPIKSVDSLGHTEQRTYYATYGTLHTFQDMNNLTTSWNIDALGRKTSELRPDGTSTTKTYSLCTTSCGSQTYNVQIATPGEPTVTTYYDLLDREFQRSITGFNSSTIWTYKNYDSVGRLSGASRNAYAGITPLYFSYSYDNANRIVQKNDPDGGFEKWSYNNLTTTISNEKNQQRIETKDSLGQLAQAADAAGQLTQYKYDPFGNLKATTDSQGHQIVATFDVLGRKTQIIDPDLGTWSYTYDGAGDQLTQKDAKNQTQTMTYDLMGRLLTKLTSEFTGTWTYDTATNGIGKLASTTNSAGFTKSYTYDSFGRVANEQTTTDTSYTIGRRYDSNSRLSQITYPTGFAVSYQYDPNGYLKELDNVSSSAMLWQRNSQNADNLSLQDTFGNGVVAASSYYTATGRLQYLTATSGTTTLQNLSVFYDTLGNVTERTDLINQYTGAKLTDSYSYDNLNRLVSDVSASGTNNFAYDALGNIVSKTNVGDFKYGDGRAGRPIHAVMSTNGPVNSSFAYDGNGNMTRGDGRTVTWTSFNKPVTIANASNTMTFSYDPSFERYKEVETTCQDYLGNSSTTCVKYLINPREDIGVHFEKEINGSITSYRHSLYAGSGNVIGVYTTRSDGSKSTNYYHKDHLGSVVLSTTDNGAVTERSSYDAFGKRRNILGTDDPSDLLRSKVSHQGFTGHEMMDDGGLGLVNMNGRVYEPLLGRFMSADTVVQQPGNLQSLNRYSYVLNNPVSLTDPSGHLFGIHIDLGSVVGFIAGGFAGAIFGSINPYVQSHSSQLLATEAIIGASVLTAGSIDGALGAGLGTSILAGAASGAVAGGLSSTLIGGGFSWQAVAMGAVTGAISGGAGSLASRAGPAVQIIVGGLSGGTTNWLQSAAQGHAGITSFIDGAILGTAISAAEVGSIYLGSSTEQSAISDGANRSPASGGPKFMNFEGGEGGGGVGPDESGLGLPEGGGGEPPISEESEESNVTFGHGDRHILDSATTQDQVEDAIRSQVAPINNAGWFSGRVTVNGVVYTFRGMTDPISGNLAIGTYFPPRDGQ
jgi:RHS repeat-associated protein